MLIVFKIFLKCQNDVDEEVCKAELDKKSESEDNSPSVGSSTPTLTTTNGPVLNFSTPPLTKRSVTLPMLLAAGILKPGDGTMTLEYHVSSTNFLHKILKCKVGVQNLMNEID